VDVFECDFCELTDFVFCGCDPSDVFFVLEIYSLGADEGVLDVSMTKQPHGMKDVFWFSQHV